VTSSACGAGAGGREVLDERADRPAQPGRQDVFFVVCDGLKGLPDVVTNVWPQTIVQTCIIHYADLWIMPTRSLNALCGSGFGLARAA
jgi:hypothetical protein